MPLAWQNIRKLRSQRRYGHLVPRYCYWALKWIFEHASNLVSRRVSATALATFPGQAGDVRVRWGARQTPFFSP